MRALEVAGWQEWRIGYRLFRRCAGKLPGHHCSAPAGCGKTVCAHELLLQNGYDILPTDASAFGFPDQLAGCLGGVPQGSSHKEAILNDNLQLVAESGKNSPIQAVAAYPSMLFVLCGRCPLLGCLAEYELAPRATRS